MAAILIGVSARSALHHERGARLNEVSQNLQVERRAQVVGVGHEHVLKASTDKLVQGATTEHGRIQVTVTRWAPLIVRASRPVRRGVAICSNLRRLVLDELE